MIGYEYNLPTSGPGNNDPQLLSSRVNSVIIIGANGSGKSRLGAWMEDKYPDLIHRIGAQRSLTFGPYIQQKSFKQAQYTFLYGSGGRDFGGRWGNAPDQTTALLNDYEHVLTAIIAQWHNEQREYIDACRNKEASGDAHDPVPLMIVDKLKEIWRQVFPHRLISLDDAKVIAQMTTSGREYEGSKMSDGERVALYLISQALCVPEGQVVIIDEPEIHLHRSIMNRLWEAIEQERSDCLFIYITHDTQFAANHSKSDKIWVKEYDGTNWIWDKVDDADMPEQLLLDILGNRKPILFVEGTNDSYDAKLYSAIYKNYYVIPCGSCSSVIERTKAMKNTPQLHHISVNGLIDRDFRNDREITALQSHGIFTLAVAEVENLFITGEIFNLINLHFARVDDSAIVNAIKYIAETKYANMRDQQTRKAAIAECKYQLSILDISGVRSDLDITTAVSNIKFDTMLATTTTKYQSTLDNDNYKRILMLFNEKGLSKSVGHFFGVDDKDYCDLIVRLASGEKSSEIREALRPYLPEEIPFEI